MWPCIWKTKPPSPGDPPGSRRALSSNPPRPTPLPSPHAEQAVAAFEALRRSTLRKRRLETLAGLLVFSALLLISFQRSQFFSSEIGGDPLARVGVFLDR